MFSSIILSISVTFSDFLEIQIMKMTKILFPIDAPFNHQQFDTKFIKMTSQIKKLRSIFKKTSNILGP